MQTDDERSRRIGYEFLWQCAGGIMLLGASLVLLANVLESGVINWHHWAMFGAVWGESVVRMSGNKIRDLERERIEARLDALEGR